MRKFALVVLAGLPLLLAGCSTFSASIDYDHTFDFSQWKTYRWVAPKGKKHADPVAGEILLQLIDREMRSRGMQNADERPDFRMAAMVTKRKGRANWGGGGRYGGGGGYGYTAGSIVISMTDAKTKNLVWWAVASDIVDMDQLAEGMMKSIQRALATIFNDFPPPPAGTGSATTE